MTEPIRVLVADGQHIYRTGLVTILEAEPNITVVGESSDGLETIDRALELKPHVILTDILMPQCDALEAMARIKETLPNTAVIIVSSSEQEDDVFRALSSGAQGYLLKRAQHAEIVQAVKMAADGEVTLSPSIATRLVSEMRDEVREPKLSNREMQVLKLLSDGLTNTEIADLLFVSDSTVRTYIHRILEKLNLKTRGEAAAYAARRHLSFARIADGLKALNVQSQAAHERAAAAGPAEETPAAKPPIKAERKQVTTLFIEIDAASSTSHEPDPEETEILIRQCLDSTAEEMYRYDGTLAWLTGNGIMFLFGAPVSQEDAPRRALYAALDAQARLQDHAQRLRERGIELDVRIGVNTGQVVASKTTGTLAMEYIPAGNTVALAATMWAMAEPGTAVLTGSTYRLAKEYFEFRYLGEAPVRGERKPVKVYQLLGAGPVKTKLEAAKARGLTVFVGRTRELELLSNRLGRVKRGKGQVVGIVGEAGIGKSRLLLEFRNRIPESEYMYLEGRCRGYGAGSMAQSHLVDILRAIFDINEGEQQPLIKQKMEEKILQLDEQLKHLLPPLHEILSLTVEDEEYLNLQPPQRSGRILEAIIQLLTWESKIRPIVMTIEDLQWIDKTSEELLTHIIGGLASARILVLLAYRTEYTHPWGSKSFYTQMSLDRLSPKSTVEVVKSILEGAEVAPELMEFIAGRAEGNPLFVEEFTRTLLEDGCIQRRQHEYILASDASAIQAPQSIQGVITARLDRLEDQLKGTLQVASVLGTEFPLPLLQAVSGTGDELKSHLIHLQGSEFIYEKPLLPVPAYTFKHALTQEVAYNSLLLEQRREFHQKAGEAIEELHPDTLEEFYELLAHHYSICMNWEKACQYSKLSGDKAVRNHSNWEALRFYSDAIRVLKKEPAERGHKTRQLEMCLLAARPMAFLCYPQGSLEILEEGRKLANELGDPRSASLIHGEMGGYYAFQGNVYLGLSHSEAAFAEAVKTQDADLVGPVALSLCVAHLPRGDFSRIVEVAPEGIASLEKTGRESVYLGGALNANVYCALLTTYGLALGHTGEFEKGKAACEKSLRFACQLDHLNSIAFGELIYGQMLFVQGDGRAAAARLQKAIRYLEQTDPTLLLAAAWASLGLANLFMGNLEVAAELVARGIKMQRDMDVVSHMSMPLWMAGMIELERGHTQEAGRALEECLTLALGNDEKTVEGIARVLLGRTWGKEGTPPPEEAEASILHGIRIAEEWKLKPWYAMGYSFLGELQADNRQQEKALENLSKAKDLFQEMGMDYWLRKNQAVLDRLT
jgi:DNA-binding NarL/FixJ family response regulator/tetratricopeptide (TPR) repeat protein